ncbi:MAG: amidophosphoribosyltransferase, partial [Nanoarchaeota archaeon]
IVLTKNGVYASSDRFPLTIGSSDKGYAVASETTAFSNLGFRSVKQLAPGEIVLFNEQGIVEQSGLTRQKQTCLFLWVYTSFPSSTFEHLNVEISRERCGAMLAKRDSIEADFVTGVPDSGIAHGVGYAIEKKIPFRRALQKYTPGWGRSYIPSDQIERDIIAHYKIIPIPEMIRGKDIILTEDSIVRGTQLRKLLKEKIWPHEPRSIHVRVACPPLMGPCNYNVSTRKGEELIALQAINAIEGMMPSNLSVYLDSDSSKYQQMVDYVKNHIGATTLQYQRMDDLLEAIGHPDDLCVSCWKG